ncbi:hypothetical protein MKW98_020743 [Papaver atlanticum]|uniref:Uncharacterized protein n=1 Tax=Papaver atlanticum TaxID=357466 RepID=A0AAD4XUX8_9MAGN|nr:hypothetical protein MKW98_020743 [Papaver atlanticum]
MILLPRKNNSKTWIFLKPRWISSMHCERLSLYSCLLQFCQARTFFICFDITTRALTPLQTTYRVCLMKLCWACLLYQVAFIVTHFNNPGISNTRI